MIWLDATVLYTSTKLAPEAGRHITHPGSPKRDPGRAGLRCLCCIWVVSDIP